MRQIQICDRNLLKKDPDYMCTLFIDERAYGTQFCCESNQHDRIKNFPVFVSDCGFWSHPNAANS